MSAEGGCNLELRREDVRKAALLGLDYVEIDATQTVLEVFFLGRAPNTLLAGNVRLSGDGAPVRVTALRVTRQRDATLDDWMEVRVDRPGDFSDYTMSLVALDAQGNPTGAPLAGFDPRYASVRFNFKSSCPSDEDCLPACGCPVPARVYGDFNYLAKDYGSFRSLIIDRLAQTMPGWQETHAPDIGVTLVELLAYAGDQLSYYQDAVATEAYLGTARQRISLRRHARLVDYVVHEGCNARAWITVGTDADVTLAAQDFFFCTDFPGAPASGVLQPHDFANCPAGAVDVFEPLVADLAAPIALYAAHTSIVFYSWGDCACCLPVGATQASLLDAWAGGVPEGDAARPRALQLKPGDFLLFEEVLGPRTGNPADADPAHRQVVRLVSVTPSVDQLYDTDSGGRPVVDIVWCAQDALVFPLCLSAMMPAPDCVCRDGISVARGNVVLADHGARVVETLASVGATTSVETCPTACRPAEIVDSPMRFAPMLQQAPLTWSQAVQPCACASTLVAQDPRAAMPCIIANGTLDGLATAWEPAADLLGSGPDDTLFVVETDNDARAHLRFGTVGQGRAPSAGTAFDTIYRVGCGSVGNVGAGTITKLVYRSLTEGGPALAPINPLPAAGGIDPETAAEIRAFAPHAFRDTIERAITANDYASIAADNVRRLAAERACDRSPFQALQAARATPRWNGSWTEMLVAIDPLGAESSDQTLLDNVLAFLESFRRIGHDLRVEGAEYVPLDLGISVCVASGVPRGDVERALRRVLGVGMLPNGAPAAFNPDSLSFAQGVAMSALVALCAAVPGVVEVLVTRLARFVPGSTPPGRVADRLPVGGVLTLGALEVARLDPAKSAGGRLTLILRGGR